VSIATHSLLVVAPSLHRLQFRVAPVVVPALAAKFLFGAGRPREKEFLRHEPTRILVRLLALCAPQHISVLLAAGSPATSTRSWTNLWITCSSPVK
jgi:hypothetical protein